MERYRPILYVNGIMLTFLGVAMVIPAGVDALYHDRDWAVFVMSALLTTFMGVGLALANRASVKNMSIRQYFMLTASAWLILPLFAAVPLWFSGEDIDFTDAVFEAMSGLTTTGSTVLVGLDHKPPGVLLWRALLQWLGGIGIIVMAILVLPLLQIGGMQLFQLDNSDKSDKAMPRITQVAAWTSGVYLGLTAACTVFLWMAGMDLFQAVAHSMTTIATGGYSTSDSSVGYFDSWVVDAIITLFMVIGSLPFILYVQLLRGRPLELWRDSQVRWFFAISGSFIGVMVLYTYAQGVYDSLGQALRYCAFNIISVMTGTGYATTDYGQWGAFAVGIFFVVMFIGGCAGSTSCGIKVFRFQVLWVTVKSQVVRLIQPHAIALPQYAGKPLEARVIDAVMSFLFIFLFSVGMLSMLLSLFGLDFITAVSSASTAIANVGPGLGEIVGPAGNFATLPEPAKWLMSFGMLLGRLEFFTVLVMLHPRFWQD